MSLTSIFKQSEMLSRVLPMRAMIMGDFGTRPWQSVDVTLQTLDNAVERMAANMKIEDGNDFAVDLHPQSIKDFTPLGIVDSSPQLKKLKNEIHLIRKLVLEGDISSSEQIELSAFVQWDVKNPPDSGELWSEYNDLKNQLLTSVDIVLNNSEFKKVERNWLSLQLLLQSLEKQLDGLDSHGINNTGESIALISIVNLSREELNEDLNSVSNINDSLFFKKVYSDELGQFGGVPFHAVCIQHEFGNTHEDIVAMQLMAVTCRSAQAMLLCAASEKLLSDPTLSEDVLLQSRFFQWRALIESVESRQILISAGHFQYRETVSYAEIMNGISYKENSDSKCSAPIHIFHLLGLADSHAKLGTPLLFSDGLNLKDISVSNSELEIIERFNPEQQYVFKELGINCPQVSSFAIKFEQSAPMRSATQFLGSKISAVVDNDASIMLLQQQFSRQIKVLVRETLGHSEPEEIKSLIQNWLNPFTHSGGFVGRSQWQKQPLEAVDITTQTRNGESTLDICLKLRLPEQDQTVDLQLEWAS